MRLPLLVVVLLSGCAPERPWCEDKAALPELKRCAGCTPTVKEKIVSPDRERSFHIAFVAEGFARDDLPRFENITRTWLFEFTERMDREVPGLTPMLNASWIDFRDLAPDDGFVLGSCATQMRGVHILVDAERMNELVPETLGRFDVIVVVVNTPTRYRENGTLAWYGSRSVVMMNSWSNGNVFAHELGHALFGLHDEYTELESSIERVSTSAASDEDLSARDIAAFFSANVSLNPSSPKFGGERQGVEGAMGYQLGAYRFGEACLMNDGESAMCPVCQKAAEERVRARRSASITNPKCGLRLSPSPSTPGQFDLLVAAFDWDGVKEMRLRTPASAQWTTTPPANSAMASQLFTSVSPPAVGDLFVEAVCVDRKGHETSVRVDLAR